MSGDHVPDEGEVPEGSGQTRRDRGRGGGGLDNKRVRFNTRDEKNCCEIGFPFSHHQACQKIRTLEAHSKREKGNVCIDAILKTTL